MSSQIAIHERKGSFSDRWIEYCREHNVKYKAVNCYDTDIIEQLSSVDSLLWHWVSHVPADVLAAKAIISTVEAMGKKVFPDSATCWHYNNKIGQKYLLESLGAPLVPTYVFYDLQKVFEWVEKTTFPKVFKLSKGAGSNNVRLVHSAAEAKELAKQAFGSGIRQSAGYFRDAGIKLKRVQQRRDLLGVLKRMPKAILNTRKTQTHYDIERDYIYFQDYIPDNKFDTRITVIGNRGFGFTRNVRENDFRASGSGSINYDPNRIDPKCVQIAFEVTKQIGGQCLAFDFVKTLAAPKIVEVSYCFMAEAVHNCPGHWDNQLNWHEGQMWPQDAILIDLRGL